MTHETNRRLLDRARERSRDLVEQDEVRAKQRKAVEMSHKKTKHGLAKRPPNLDDVQSSLDGWQEQIDEALATARAVAEREQALSRAKAVDGGRFPATAAGGEH